MCMQAQQQRRGRFRARAAGGCPPPSAVSCAVCERRGSTTMRPPAARAPARWPMNGGMVAATFEPSSRMVLRVVEVGDRERQPAVDAERAVAGRRGGRHAEPAVVVDARGAERQPGELAELVRLLVGEAAAAEDADRIRPVLARGWRAGGRRSRSSASSQVASREAVVAPRMSGVVMRPGAARSSAEVQPFLQRPPRLVGNDPPGHRRPAPGRRGRGRERHRALQGAVRAVRVGRRAAVGRLMVGAGSRRPSDRARRGGGRRPRSRW